MTLQSSTIHSLLDELLPNTPSAAPAEGEFDFEFPEALPVDPVRVVTPLCTPVLVDGISLASQPVQQVLGVWNWSNAPKHRFPFQKTTIPALATEQPHVPANPLHSPASLTVRAFFDQTNWRNEERILDSGTDSPLAQEITVEGVLAQFVWE